MTFLMRRLSICRSDTGLFEKDHFSRIQVGNIYQIMEGNNGGSNKKNQTD